jgi:hypothetical protein
MNTVINFINLGFEVLTAVVMKSSIFWDIKPCSPLKFNRRFGGTYRLHLQGQKISRARNQRESRLQNGTHRGRGGAAEQSVQGKMVLWTVCKEETLRMKNV